MEHDSWNIHDPAMMPETVPVIPVRHLSEGIEFYAKVGFTVEAESRVQALLSRGDSKLMLDAKAAAESGSAVKAYFFVDCTETFTEELRALKIAVACQGGDRPWRMREIAITDPDGNQLRFAEKFQQGVYC